MTTSELRELGVTRGGQRAEVAAERWVMRHANVVAVAPSLDERLRTWWAAVLACSPRSRARGGCTAALGGVTALLAAGLSGIDDDGRIHVVAPKSSHPRPSGPDIRVHETRRWRNEDIVSTGIPRSRTPVAAVQAALWARTDREAALLLVAPVQQRLTTAADVAEAAERIQRDRRRGLLRRLCAELLDGVRSLNELDFARFCRIRGLPEPSRQVVVRTTTGRAYLDVRWDRWRVVVEVDGIGHLQVERWLDDSLRHNEIALGGDLVLRIPSLGLMLDADRQIDMVERALRRAGWRPARGERNTLRHGVRTNGCDSDH